MSGTQQGAGGVGGLLAVTSHTTPLGTHFVAMDGNGNVTALVSTTNSAVTARYEYDPFGRLLGTNGPAAGVNPFQFSTKYYDGEVGTLYYGYRDYEAGKGRWVSRDPIEERVKGSVPSFYNSCLTATG